MKLVSTAVAPVMLAASLAGLAPPAYAQHEGHTMPPPPPPVEQPEPGPDGVHAGHDMPGQPADAAAHESHDVPAQPAEHGMHEGHGQTPAREPAAPLLPATIDSGSMDHAMHQMVPAASPSTAALAGPIHAADTLFDARAMAAARAQLRREHGGFTTHMLLADRFESGTGDGPDSYRWDLQGWAGNDLDRFWWKTDGGGESGHNPDDFEVQALYSRAVTPFFDVQAGLRYDAQPGPQRSHAVIGVQGLLPYVFEIDAAVFVSDTGDWTARFEAEYDMRIRQRLVLQPRIQLDFAAQSIPELGLGTGLGSIETGLRLRYEVRREIAPYIGIDWLYLQGGTADLARSAAGVTQSWQTVLGLRAWF